MFKMEVGASHNLTKYCSLFTVFSNQCAQTGKLHTGLSLLISEIHVTPRGLHSISYHNVITVPPSINLKQSCVTPWGRKNYYLLTLPVHVTMAIVASWSAGVLLCVSQLKRDLLSDEQLKDSLQTSFIILALEMEEKFFSSPQCICRHTAFAAVRFHVSREPESQKFLSPCSIPTMPEQEVLPFRNTTLCSDRDGLRTKRD